MRMLRWFVLTLCVWLYGCDVDNQYGSPYECNFIFYTSYHTSSALTLALTNPGTFVTVESSFQNGIYHLKMKVNNGQEEDLPITTAKETRINYNSMGANRRLIIGCSLANGMKAYDGQCSNCLIQYGGVRYPLEWIQNGQKLQCSRCKRIYDPNAEGVPVENAQKGDRALYQYIISHNGEVLHVYNGQSASW